MLENVDQVWLLGLFVVPGLVSMQIYRFLIPAREISWSDVFLQAFFYSSINFALLFPLIFLSPKNIDAYWVELWGILVLYLFIAPSIWPVILTALFRSKAIAKRIKIPSPSTWDFFFGNNKRVFLMVHLNSGDVIGGLWDENSYAGTDPLNGDLYIEVL